MKKVLRGDTNTARWL